MESEIKDLTEQNLQQSDDYEEGMRELRFELDNVSYERDQFKKALTDVKKKVQDKVPILSHVEERRVQLE